MINKKILLLFLVTIFIYASCKSDRTRAIVGEELETGKLKGDYVTLTIDLKDSRIQWRGEKPFVQNWFHIGTIDIAEGELHVADNQLAGGSIVINMATIDNIDLRDRPDMHARLVNHLKSSDFFSVDSFPTATIVFTHVSELAGNDEYTHEITGNLTIKGITKSITFPALLIFDNDQNLTAYSKFYIDRSEWDVRYGSTKFNPTLMDQAKDKIINNEVELEITLVAKSAVPYAASN